MPRLQSLQRGIMEKQCAIPARGIQKTARFSHGHPTTLALESLKIQDHICHAYTSRRRAYKTDGRVHKASGSNGNLNDAQKESTSNCGAAAGPRGQCMEALFGLLSSAKTALTQHIYMHFTSVVVQMNTVYPAAFCKRLHNGELKSPSANAQIQAITPALSFPQKYWPEIPEYWKCCCYNFCQVK